MRTAGCMLVGIAVIWTAPSIAQAQNCLSRLCPFGCCHAKGGADAPITHVADSGQGTQTTAVFNKVGSGTRRFIANTRDLFTFGKPSGAPASAGGKYAFRSSPKKPGFFYKLFHPEPPPPPKTVDEWMSLEQIHP